MPSSSTAWRSCSGPLIVGLTINPEALVQIRRNRQQMLGLEEGDGERFGGDYADIDRIRGELVLARRLFARHRWPEIDVTKRSVEETAASIYQLVQARQQPELEGPGRIPCRKPGWSGDGA